MVQRGNGRFDQHGVRAYRSGSQVLPHGLSGSAPLGEVGPNPEGSEVCPTETPNTGKDGNAAPQGYPVLEVISTLGDLHTPIESQETPTHPYPAAPETPGQAPGATFQVRSHHGDEGPKPELRDSPTIQPSTKHWAWDHPASMGTGP